MRTLVAVAGLDYSRRAVLLGDEGPLDAIAASVNMLSEELESANATVSRRTRELNDKRQILQSILDGMSDGVAVANLAGEFLVFNPAAERLLGKGPVATSPAEWTAQYSIYRADGSGMLPPGEVPLARVLRGESIDDAEVLVRRPGAPDGALLSVTGRPLRNGDEVYAGVVVFRDITENRRAEASLRRLAAIVELSDDAILTYGTDMIITSWNGGAERLYGYAAGEIVGTSVLRIMGPERAREPQQILDNVLAGRHIGHFETARIAKGGARVLISLSAAPVHDGAGAIKGVSIIARDISRAKRVEEELQRAKEAAEAATRAKSDFLANVSHEVRTPLTAILGFAELLLSSQVSDSERLNYVMTLRRNGEHLLAVLNDLLDLSKIEAGKMTVELIPTSPTQILQEVASLMRVRAIEKGLDLKLEYRTPIPAQLLTDPTRLKQILLNLVSNAIKFTSAGHVRIRASCEAPETEQPFLVVQVIDTGIGISEDELEGLFQPFVQADTSTTRRFGGTGLGLGICKPLATSLGGEITVETARGRGSCFALRLGLPPLSGMEMIADPLLSAPGKLGSGRDVPSRRLSGRVLLAEDGPDNQLLIASILQKRGATVSVAPNGRLAIENALSAVQSGSPYDLILMDMQMPEVDGYAATAHLRSKGYGGAIVALTANAMTGERATCLQAGCDDYMTKPIEMGSFLSLVLKYLPESNFARDVPSGSHLCALPSNDVPLTSEFVADPEMADVLARFTERLRTQVVTELRAASANMDRQVLKRLAHQLKGAGSGYGYPAISAAAGKLENAVQDDATAPEVAKRAQILCSLCERAGRMAER
jgi:PAS domain S-box-containing protein